MSDCAPQFDPERDPPDTLYGFTRAEWAAAGARSGGSAGGVAADWDRVQAILRAGGTVGLGAEGVLALGRLGPDYARRMVARLGLDPAGEVEGVEDAAAAFLAAERARGREPPAWVIESVRRDVAAELAQIAELCRLALRAGG